MINLDIVKKQIIPFVLTSGVGWLIDLSIYSVLATVMGFNVMYSNLISTVPAFTFVFFVSVRHIFKNNIHILAVKYKFAIYFIYQFVLVYLISVFGQWLYNVLLSFATNLGISVTTHKFVVKILITPVTIVLNFLVMKVLTEKL